MHIICNTYNDQHHDHNPDSRTLEDTEGLPWPMLSTPGDVVAHFIAQIEQHMRHLLDLSLLDHGLPLVPESAIYKKRDVDYIETSPINNASGVRSWVVGDASNAWYSSAHP